MTPWVGCRKITGVMPTGWKSVLARKSGLVPYTLVPLSALSTHTSPYRLGTMTWVRFEEPLTENSATPPGMAVLGTLGLLMLSRAAGYSCLYVQATVPVLVSTAVTLKP